MKKFPLITFIELPQNSKKIFVEFAYRYGYVNENNSHFGLAHLFEHYIVSQIDKVLPKANISGSIGDSDLRFCFETSEEKIISDIKIFSQFISERLPVDEEIFAREKMRIEAEIHERYSDFLSFVRDETMKRVIAKPSVLVRTRKSQLPMVSCAKPFEIDHLRRFLLRAAPRYFIIGSKKLPDRKTNEIRTLIESTMLSVPTKKTDAQIVYKKKCIATMIDPRVPRDFVHQTYFFKGFGFREKLAYRYIFSFLSGLLYEDIQSGIAKLGAYSADFELHVDEQFGFVRFFLFVPAVHKEECDAFVSQLIANLLTKNDVQKKLNAFIAIRKKNITHAFNNNDEVMEWAADDVFDFGAVLTKGDLYDGLDSMTLKSIARMAKEKFAVDNMYTFTVYPEISNKKTDRTEKKRR